MDAIIGLVALAAPACDGVIAKGGITSAQVATDGLQAAAAFVKGQLEPGVSLWEIGLPDGRRIPYAVIPGNVGHDLTMTEVAAKFGVHMRSGSAQAGKTPDSKIPHTSKSSHSMEGIRSKPEPESGSDTEGDRRSFQLTPIKKESIVAIVTRQLMSFLLSGAVRPGERIPAERQLAETLGVGRSTLRESLKVLTVLGLLEARLGDGTYLKKADSELLPGVIEWGLLLGEKSTKDLIEARQKIEVIIASLAAERRSSEQLAELRSFLKVMEQEGSGESRFVEADIAFHMKLADMADNSALRDMLRSVQALLRTWITSVIQSPGSIQATYEEHSRIYEAVERGDAQEAEEAMDLHMKSATLRLLKAQADAGIL
jgi:GntR family transcriptional repressor for pyruvate dehydrogenase complex